MALFLLTKAYKPLTPPLPPPPYPVWMVVLRFSAENKFSFLKAGHCVCTPFSIQFFWKFDRLNLP